ncbi:MULTISPECIES: hypothetical protein [Bacillus cereus group]|uniref:hypothetical protein n=1 Tax=Bacillus cereus group TaxID=86661 RepID=UPI0001A1A2D7|nr:MULTISPECIES: hypothetical protein [Bacillus cereus group]EEM50116.1 hypothetical protein bthur0006_56130 [Bacillus thuringiensis serovar kurstaki str. T03a001]MCC3933200.1 hypothetical protein [Bacillus thuringiensis]MCC3995830.1 hypothetical protein [Bacillus thuringiensis]MCC4027095.1 hypothetical protein [Bacillus thuringiensis serovar kurstaki]MCI0762781.1 hypothetical protein [Bacillus cereus]
MVCLNLKVYQIIQLPNDEMLWKQVVQKVVSMGFFPGEHKLRYCVNKDFNYENGVFVGALHEQYIPDQTSIDADREETSIENIEPWERTIFAIDFNHRKLLIQQRDYSPKNLSRTTARTRITGVLDAIWQEVFEAEFNYIMTNLFLGNEYFIKNFVEKTRVLGAKLRYNEKHGWAVTNIYDGTKFEESWKDMWNSDESHLHEIVLRARGGGDLNNSPLFKLALSPGGLEIESITYYDSQEDKPKTESRTAFDLIEVPDVTKRTEILTALHQSHKYIMENQKKLAALRAINLE